MQTNILQAISNKTGKTEEELKIELNKEFESLDKNIPEETRKAIATNRLTAMYRKELSSRGAIYEGIFIGANSPMDLIAAKRRAAMELFKKDRDSAIRQKITDVNGEPLFFATEKELEKMPEWAKKKLGKPMPKNDIQRLVVGAVKVKQENETEEWIPMYFRVRGENTKVIIPTNIQVNFPALKLESSTSELVRFNDAGKLQINTIGEELNDEQIKGLYIKLFKNHIITLSQIDTFVQQHQEFERFAIIKALVTEIVPMMASTGSQIIRIEDETVEFVDAQGNIVPPMTCFVSDHIKIDFPERSEIYVVGQPNITDRGKNINVLGIYTPKIFRNSVPSNKPEISEEEVVHKW
jgi:hypothetical protein